jgi:hypothetical protein
MTIIERLWWSLRCGNSVVPSRWQATPEGPLDFGPTRPARRPWKGRSTVRGEGDEVSVYRDIGLSAVSCTDFWRLLRSSSRCRRPVASP